MTAATEMWWDLGDSYQARQAAVTAVACPHCHAAPGVQCRTPNGWAALHKARINVAAGHARSASTPATADNHDRQGTPDTRKD